MNYFVTFLVSTLVCWSLIPLLIRYASNLGMVDMPGERKVHSVSIPRCGGIGIAVGTLSAIFLMPFGSIYYALIAGGVIIVLFGIADDIIELHYKWKFLGQIAAVCFVISQGIFIKVVPFLGANEAPLFISYTLTFLFVVGATNAVNLSDGLDGLAAGIMLLSLASIVVFALLVGEAGEGVGIIAIAMIGGVIGFLRFNTHPAVIFMGDTGSQFLGFMAAFLAILLTQNVSVAFNPALPLLIMGLPILDTLSVMTQRIRAGRSPFSPDKRHIHHKLLVYGFTHEEAVAVIYFFQVIFLISAFILRYSADWEVVGFYLLIASSVLMAFYWAGAKKWTVHVEQISNDRRRGGLRKHSWLFPFCRVYIEYAIIIYLVFLLACLWYFSAPLGYQELVILLISIVILKWVSIKAQDILIRISIYNSVLYSCYMVSKLPYSQQAICYAMDVFFTLLLLVTILAIRVTRSVYFKVTTQDMLVVIFMVASIFVLSNEYITRAIFYLFCLGYALEYLFHRKAYIFRLFRFLAFFVMLNFGVFLVAFL